MGIVNNPRDSASDGELDWGLRVVALVSQRLAGEKELKTSLPASQTWNIMIFIRNRISATTTDVHLINTDFMSRYDSVVYSKSD